MKDLPVAPQSIKQEDLMVALLLLLDTMHGTTSEFSLTLKEERIRVLDDLFLFFFLI